MRRIGNRRKRTDYTGNSTNNVFAVSGLFLTRPTTGMERYAIEVTRGLDSLVDDRSEIIYLVVPRNTAIPYTFKNIQVIQYGRKLRGNLGGYLWEQTSFAWFLRRSRAEGYLPLSFVPALTPDVVVTIHDANAISHPEFYPSWRKKLYRLLAASLIRVARRRTRRVLTVSSSSRDELVDLCGFDRINVGVAYPGLDHVPVRSSNVAPPRNIPARYYFALSSATYNKNFEWVLRTAASNPSETFLIAGSGNFDEIKKKIASSDALQNVRHLGYVTDGERNALYANCTAFLFPSRYEGFGLPPLEAACLGAPIVVSDIPPMREIFGEEFRYVDPDRPAVQLETFVNSPDIDRLRATYTWRLAAEEVLLQLRRRSGVDSFVGPGGRTRP